MKNANEVNKALNKQFYGSKQSNMNTLQEIGRQQTYSTEFSEELSNPYRPNATQKKIQKFDKAKKTATNNQWTSGK